MPMNTSSWMFRDQYTFKPLESFKNEPGFKELRDSLLAMPPAVGPLNPLEKEQQEKLLARTKNLMSFRLGVYFKSEMIGFTRAIQTDSNNLHMIMSGVRPDHQRQGIYTELLKSVLDFSKNQGFQSIESYHRSTNNAVIIAKLRAGFVINGITISDIMGTLVRLTYFHQPERKKLMEMRSGLIRPEGHLRDLFF
jgi:RimJ/RimL family protein N-acetyltransferase